MVDFNVLKLLLIPQKSDPPLARLDPPSDHPPIEYEPDAEVNAPAATRLPFAELIGVRAPRHGSEPAALSLTMHDPGKWVAGVIRRRLIDAGIELVDPPAPQEGKPSPRLEETVVVHEGPPLAEILEHFNHVSENAVGEILLHEIAIAHGIQRPTWNDGAAVFGQWLVATAGLDRDAFRIVDGSGLSRYNLITADSSTRLLAFMHRHRHARTFYDSLLKYTIDGEPVAGEPDPPDTLPVAAKSGGMSSVSTISGYVTTHEGRRLAFSLLAGGFIGTSRPVLKLRGRVWRTLERSNPDLGVRQCCRFVISRAGRLSRASQVGTAIPTVAAASHSVPGNRGYHNGALILRGGL